MHDARAVTALRIMPLNRNVTPAQIEVLLSLSVTIATTEAHVSTPAIEDHGSCPLSALSRRGNSVISFSDSDIFNGLYRCLRVCPPRNLSLKISPRPSCWSWRGLNRRQLCRRPLAWHSAERLPPAGPGRNPADLSGKGLATQLSAKIMTLFSSFERPCCDCLCAVWIE